MLKVFVLAKNKKPLMPCTAKRARKLLDDRKAVVHKMFPFTIRLKFRNKGVIQPIEFKVDPGSKYTGVALARVVPEKTNGVDDWNKVGKELVALMFFQLNHRGDKISKNMEKRANYRGGRRSRNLRNRKPRFDNRKKPEGWIAPSLNHRVESIENFYIKLAKLVPIHRLKLERVKFDVQRLENPEIKGVQYQQGTLKGYTVKAYLLEKFNYKCVYCGEKGRLEVEHIKPRSKGGSDRVSNLTVACRDCNQKKGDKLPEEWLKDRPKLLKDLQAKAKKGFKDAAAVNATRKVLKKRLKSLSTANRIQFKTSTGVTTNYNRNRFNVPKDHCLDALLVGNVRKVSGWERLKVLHIDCMGRGQYRRTIVDGSGFPRCYFPRTKFVFGFQTGDVVKAILPKGKYVGTYIGRISVRTTGSFSMRTKEGKAFNVNYKNCKLLQRNDGYSYSLKAINI